MDHRCRIGVVMRTDETNFHFYTHRPFIFTGKEAKRVGEYQFKRENTLIGLFLLIN